MWVFGNGISHIGYGTSHVAAHESFYITLYAILKLHMDVNLMIPYRKCIVIFFDGLDYCFI